MTIEMRHLRYVIAAAEHGSFRRAAEVLNVEQSAVSRRIRDLEDEIGAALFIRHHGGVLLTGAGEHFLVRARKAVSQIQHAAADAATFGRGEAGTVRIGILSSLASGFLADLLRSYVVANPKIRPDFVEGAPAFVSHVGAVQRHHLDVAFLPGELVVEGCDVKRLWCEQVFVVLPSEHALAARSEICWADLRTERFIVTETDPGPAIHDYLVKHLADIGRRPRVDRQAVGRDNLMQLVAMGQGLTLTSEAITATRFPGVVFRPLNGQVWPYSAIWSPRNDNPALRRLLSLARSLSRGQQVAATPGPSLGPTGGASFLRVGALSRFEVANSPHERIDIRALRSPALFETNPEANNGGA